MQELTIKVNDAYAQKLFDLLELFPKNALKIETKEQKKAKELEKHAKLIRESLEDIKEGRVTPRGEIWLKK